ncbi:MAG: hypothetical protein ACTSU5_12765 [Promethearchaeota archaeon]
MSSKEIVKALSQAQVASLIQNLMDYFNEKRLAVRDALGELDLDDLTLLANIVSSTSANVQTSKLLRASIRRVNRQRARRREYLPLTRKRKEQLKNAVIDALGGHECRIDDVILSTLTQSLARVHLLDDQALVPRSTQKLIKREAEKLKGDES